MTVMSEGSLLNSNFIKMGREEGVFKLSSNSQEVDMKRLTFSLIVISQVPLQHLIVKPSFLFIIKFYTG